LGGQKAEERGVYRIRQGGLIHGKCRRATSRGPKGGTMPKGELNKKRERSTIIFAERREGGGRAALDNEAGRLADQRRGAGEEQDQECAGS